MDPKDDLRDDVDARWWWPWLGLALVLTAAAIASVLPETPRELRAEPQPEVQTLTPEWADPSALPASPAAAGDATETEHVATF